MGQKTLPAQRRGAAKPKYLANKKIGISEAKYSNDISDFVGYKIKAFKVSPLKTAILAKVEFFGNRKKEDYILAPYNSYIGEEIKFEENSNGSIKKLRDIPEGKSVYNIENIPKDGGQFCRSGGTSGLVRQKKDGKVLIVMPSKKIKEFNEKCLATIGFSAGGDRKIKPLLRAGKKHHAIKRKCIEWPFVSRNSKNVKDHKFGGSGKKRPGAQVCVSRHAPPGRKVGHIAPRRTGRKNK